MELQRLIVVLLVFGGGFWLLRPLVQAFARRVEHRGEPLGPAAEEVLEELREVRRDVAELAERVDFAERLLAKQREGQRLPSAGGS